jgi:hypothetical protein
VWALRLQTLAAARDVDGDRQARIRSHVETRATICKRWLPWWRALLHDLHKSEELVPRVERMRAAIVARLELMYAPELSTLSQAKRLCVDLQKVDSFYADPCRNGAQGFGLAGHTKI